MKNEQIQLTADTSEQCNDLILALAKAGYKVKSYTTVEQVFTVYHIVFDIK